MCLFLFRIDTVPSVIRSSFLFPGFLFSFSIHSSLTLSRIRSLFLDFLVIHVQSGYYRTLATRWWWMGGGCSVEWWTTKWNKVNCGKVISGKPLIRTWSLVAITVSILSPNKVHTLPHLMQTLNKNHLLSKCSQVYLKFSFERIYFFVLQTYFNQGLFSQDSFDRLRKARQTWNEWS